jgi:hypothetical protein
LKHFELLLVFLASPRDFTRPFVVNLSTLSILLGAVVALLNLVGVLQPAKFADAARKFPRSLPVGYVLMLLGTVWFVWNVAREPISDFEPFKPYLSAFFIAVGVGACMFVRDFLAVRGLAVVLLLLAKTMVDLARWVETDWRLVIVSWAYVLVFAGMWFTVSPWRLRDLLNWMTANETRTRVGSVVRCGFGILVLILGATVFRGK